ncbi:MAG: hypothetical protein LBC63_09055 [Holophagales bacterium]|nr:hypothetical protein [Holophagales bacterium]
MKSFLCSLAFFVCLPCCAQYVTPFWVREATERARSSIYAIAGDECDLYVISKYSRKGVKLHILIGIGTAKRSDDLKSLIARGAVIWVDTRAGVDRTMMVVDKTWVWDGRGLAINEYPTRLGPDDSLAHEYYRQWCSEVTPSWVVPCYSPSLERERAALREARRKAAVPTRPWPPGAPERPT